MTTATPDQRLGRHELSHLDALEAEAVFIFREVAAELEHPVVLFSGGKDSIVLLRLAEKAFRPAGFPFPVMHIDTGHNFPEVLDFRDRRVAELWSLYNGRIRKGEHIRAFPISNWTELDVWQYIEREQLEVPQMYFAHRRQVVERDTMLLAVSQWIQPKAGEKSYEATVRYRTVGDMNCTGAVESSATTVAEIIAEVAATRITERGATRADDRFSEAAMEDRKKEGYF